MPCFEHSISGFFCATLEGALVPVTFWEMRHTVLYTHFPDRIVGYAGDSTEFINAALRIHTFIFWAVT